MTINAVYQNGAFVPEAPVSLPEGAKVRIDIRPAAQEDDAAILAALQKRFPNSIGILPEDDAAEMTKIIEEEFGRVNPDEWEWDSSRYQRGH